jgi:Cu-processing system permease protein
VTGTIQSLIGQVRLTILWAIRDRVLHAVFGVSLLLLLLVPVFSDFSMRQVQESAISLALSASSLTLLLVAALLGSAAIFRDVDRRYTAAVLGLPIARSHYLLGRLLGLALFLVMTAALLFLCSAAVIAFAATTYPSPIAVPWATVALAFVAISLKAILLAALALLFSSISTSFSLPFFCTLGIWFAGSASQEAYEYITGSLGNELPVFAKLTTQALYYLLPNFSGLNLQIQAIYGLPLVTGDVLSSFLYAFCYTAMVAWLSVVIFARRELP